MIAVVECFYAVALDDRWAQQYPQRSLLLVIVEVVFVMDLFLDCFLSACKVDQQKCCSDGGDKCEGRYFDGGAKRGHRNLVIPWV